MTLLFIPFIKYFVMIATFLIKEKKTVLYESMIDDRFLTTPSVAVMQVSKEVVRMGSLAMETLNTSIDGFINHNFGVKEEVHNKIKIIDAMNTDILAYLVKVSAQDITPHESKFVSVLHHSLNDFYRAVEIADNMVKYTRHLVEDPLKFSDTVFEEINLFRNKLNEQFDKVQKVLLDKEYNLLTEVDALEDEMDKLRSKMINDHIGRLERGECSPISSGVYINLVSNLERAGDHLHLIVHNVVDNI
jgi:phosphate:Na+ symporter